AEKITVLLKDSDKEYEATVVGSDPDTDVALRKIKSGNHFPFVLLGDSDAVRIGDIAIAIGNPFGLSSTFTTGVVSAMGRTGMGNKYENFIQTDVAINPGNSGGPLLSIRGEVVGINSMIFSQSGGSIGISFSIPINMAKRIVDQIRSKGKVTRAWLGIGLSDVTPELAKDLEIPQGGVYVPEVSKGSPAEKGGIKPGDILVTLDGNKIRDAADFRNRVNEISPGKTVSIELIRKKKKMEVQVTVEVLAENQSPDGEGSGSFLGLKVAAMSDEVKKQYKVGEAFGVVVEGIEESSPLAERGVRAGDIVVMVNYEETKNLADYTRVMRGAVKNKKVIFHVQRGNYLRVLAVYIK
ncbi:MAG: PDZ domain-containing protein, partial [Spirochaetia bacterium]|nr:PDZ domain-containing protein [Spirochaetia bacterium]